MLGNEKDRPGKVCFKGLHPGALDVLINNKKFEFLEGLRLESSRHISGDEGRVKIHLEGTRMA